MSTPQSARLEALGQQARTLMAAGRLDEAAAVWEQVLAAAPEHPQALLHLGQHALYRKDFAKARPLLERAAKARPDDPAVHLNLAFIHRGAGDNEAEMAALMQALTIDPYFYPALLSRAMLLERTGRKHQAAKVYKDVLTIAPPAEQIPAGLKEPLEHARQVVKANAAEIDAYLESRLAGLRSRHKGEDLSRFDQCKDVATGAKKVYVQQPTVLHYPGLPATQFYERARFPWLATLEAATADIRAEFLKVFEEDNSEFTPYVQYEAGTPVNQWAELNHSPRWSALHLWRDGKRDENVCRRCPRTAAAVESIPMAQIPNFSPNVLFSLLAPHTTIPPHTSSTNIRLITHLPLIVPGDCRFRVGNETRPWVEGQAWVFDDTIDHEAWNDSDHLRVILMVDVWNPHLEPAERELVSELLNGVRSYYAAADRPS